MQVLFDRQLVDAVRADRPASVSFGNRRAIRYAVYRSAGGREDHLGMPPSRAQSRNRTDGSRFDSRSCTGSSLDVLGRVVATRWMAVSQPRRQRSGHHGCRSHPPSTRTVDAAEPSAPRRSKTRTEPFPGGPRRYGRRGSRLRLTRDRAVTRAERSSVCSSHQACAGQRPQRVVILVAPHHPRRGRRTRTLSADARRVWLHVRRDGWRRRCAAAPAESPSSGSDRPCRS